MAKKKVKKEEDFFQIEMESEKKTDVMSESDIDRLLNAIKKQRWYFFKNKPKVLMDRDTGLLWANLNIFPWHKQDRMFKTVKRYWESEVHSVINSFNDDNYTGWRLPTFHEFEEMIKDRTFPFGDPHDSSSYGINKNYFWYCEGGGVGLFRGIERISSESAEYILPNNDILIAGTDYAEKASANNLKYTEKERLQATLDLFVRNELWPIFNDNEITELYKDVCFLKPKKAEQEEQVKAVLYSSEFDYMELLEKYDIQAIDASVIKYYQAVQQWTDELLTKLDHYEQQKEAVIREFNSISLKLAKKYEANKNLTEEENSLLENRQKYFQKKFSLDIRCERSKLLSVKKQADDIEGRIDEIDNGDRAIYALAALKQEQRADFSLVAENTAKIFRNLLLKIEYFEQNRAYVSEAVELWEKWTEAYLMFRTTYKEEFKSTCEEDEIEEEIWSAWYEDWRTLRFTVEQKVQPVIARGLSDGFASDEADGSNMAVKIMNVLEAYKNAVDKFYMEERKGIYQKYAFQSGGELQDRLETENCLYHCVAEFQSSLQEIIFRCKNKDDRIFILNWSDGLADFQIDRIFEFAADYNLQETAKTILNEFSELKQKTLDIYMEDAKAYSEEKSRREKQYNSLIYKMRKNLAE